IFLQNSYASENQTDYEQKIKDKEIFLNRSSIAESNTTTQNEESNINFVAVGDWDCTQYTKDTVKYSNARSRNSFSTGRFIL
ncbi:MAG: hypothetical protein ACXWFZ_08205, partial [Nitrososphaeraceae archaeon]